MHIFVKGLLYFNQEIIGIIWYILVYFGIDVIFCHIFGIYPKISLLKGERRAWPANGGVKEGSGERSLENPTNWLVLTGFTEIRYPPTTVLTGMLAGHFSNRSRALTTAPPPHYISTNGL